MKKKGMFLIAFILVSLISFGQTERKNVVKVFPTSFVFGKGTFAYERVINENGSFTLNLGLPTGIDPFKYFPMEESGDIIINDGKLDALLIMSGYRFNLSKKNAPLGFYFEPYLKYEKFGTTINSEFVDDENERFISDITGNYSGIGLGFQMGVQCFIGDVVSLDWSFLGFEGKSGKIDFTYSDLSGGVNIDDVYDELQNNFTSDIPIIGDKLEFEKGAGFVKGKAKGMLLPGLRSAFSIGIAF